MFFERKWSLLKAQIKSAQASCSSRSISPSLLVLLIAGEDHRFGCHYGVDPIALCRAVWRSIFCQRQEGGSTIAMQLVRVLTGRYEKTLSRKIMEIYLAVRMTRHIPQNEILSLYLSVAYFGWKMNGLNQACARLKLDPSSLSPQAAASIVARLKYPEPRYPSYSRTRKIQIRAAHIMHRYKRLFGAHISYTPELSENNGSV